MDQLYVVTHPDPLMLDVRRLDHAATPEGAVALAYFYRGHLLARGVVAPDAVDAIRGLLERPVSLALAATEDDQGNIDARVCLVLPVDGAMLGESEEEPEEPWRASVPAPPPEVESGYGDPAAAEDDEKPRLALLPIGNVVRGVSHRTTRVRCSTTSSRAAPRTPSPVRSTISSTASERRQEARFRRIYRRVHAHHPACLADEWLSRPCTDGNGEPVVPIVWSRRNGPWRRVSVLWVGAAPGNAGGRGRGSLGAHGTRIPFGGDLAGANLEVLLGAIGLDRNHTFITAAFNSLPARGGGEPSVAEIRAPVGEYANSVELLADTILATGARLIVALGNVALRTTAAALSDEARLPGIARLTAAGLERGASVPSALLSPAERFISRGRRAWEGDALPHVLWLTHPSGQNMSPYAGTDTGFHRRMSAARDQIRRVARDVLGIEPPRRRAPVPSTGIYALPEWRCEIAPVHDRLDRLWRNHGL